jgi:hypothetical protein
MSQPKSTSQSHDQDNETNMKPNSKSTGFEGWTLWLGISNLIIERIN